MELEIKGTLTKIGETIQGVNKAGDTWQKLIYTVTTDAKYNSLFAFEVFGKDASTMFRKYNVEGSKVTVKFNVNTNEWQGKYFTTLQSWRCTKDDSQTTAKAPVQAEAEDDLPF